MVALLTRSMHKTGSLRESLLDFKSAMRAAPRADLVMTHTMSRIISLDVVDLPELG